MEKPVAIIEITNMAVRVLIGNIVDDKPVILFTTERPIEGMVVRGDIVDFSALANVFANLRKIYDEANHICYNVSEATVIFPPVGFQVYLGDKTTNTASQSNIVTELDVKNVISLIQKEPVPNGSEIVDIIPDAFILDGSRSFLNPPLNEKTNMLQLRAKVQTLPTRIVSDYKRVIDSASIHVRRSLVNTYALTELNKIDESMPASYILVDMGAGLTNLALVGNHSIYTSSEFLLGGNDLVMKISDSLGVSEEEARDLMEIYGINDRSLTFQPVISASLSPDGSQVEHTPNELNSVIIDFMSNYYFKQMDNALVQLLNGYGDDIKRLPIVITGGFSKLNGFKKLIKEKYPNNTIMFLSPKAIGVRDPKYSSLVGALIASSHYKGTLSDTNAKVTHIDRVKKD